MDTISKPEQINWVKTTGLILIVAVFFPFLIHMIPPYNGFPMGAYLLPMFYIPFIALFWYDWKVALPVAIFAPILNFLVTGNPQWAFLLVLTLELVFFTGIAFLLLKQNHLKWLAAPLGYVGAKVISSLLLLIVPLMPAAPLEFFFGSLSRALPGIGILLLLNFMMLKFGSPTRKGKAY
jgi:membrane-associated HD superfamily phosphohydrolase